MARNVLSVDWDYFFPDDFDFDWGHNENRTFFLEGVIWYIRAHSQGMIRRRKAIEVYRPKGIKEFWQKVCPQKPSLLVVAETHHDILGVLFKGDVVFNFDAHHDCGYGQAKPEDCGSWGKSELIREYHLVYPSWRKEFPEEKDMSRLRPMTVHYEIPELPRFDLVFICRSSAWTPPWSDNEWMNFISHWKRFPNVWKRRLKSPYASKQRPWDQAVADKIVAEWEEFRNGTSRSGVNKTS